MTKDELSKLDRCCEMIGTSRSEVIRTGIEIVYANLDKLRQKPQP